MTIPWGGSRGSHPVSFDSVRFGQVRSVRAWDGPQGKGE